MSSGRQTQAFTPCRAAQEVREHKRRDKAYHDAGVVKYYAEQRHMDAAAASAGKDGARRLQREANEMAMEQAMLETLERVRLLPLRLAISARAPEGRATRPNALASCRPTSKRRCWSSG